MARAVSWAARRDAGAGARWVRALAGTAAVLIYGVLLVTDIAHPDRTVWWMHGAGVTNATLASIAALFAHFRLVHAGPRTAVAVALIGWIPYVVGAIIQGVWGVIDFGLNETLIGLLAGLGISGLVQRYGLWRVTREHRGYLGALIAVAGMSATVMVLVAVVGGSMIIPPAMYEYALGAAAGPMILGLIAGEQVRGPSRVRARWMVGIGVVACNLLIAYQLYSSGAVPSAWQHAILTIGNALAVAGVLVSQGVWHMEYSRTAGDRLNRRMRRKPKDTPPDEGHGHPDKSAP